MEWLRVSASEPDAEALRRAAAVLRAGGLVIYPTDTLYGLAADPRVEAGVNGVMRVKGRPANQALPLVAASVGQAEHQVAVLSEISVRLARRFWPGPLTLVADARQRLADGVAGDGGTLALRVPDHAVARGLADALGFAVTSTSANPSGREAPQTAEQAALGLQGQVDLILDAGPTHGGLPSTIVDARTPPPRLLRAGALPFDLVLEFLSTP